MAKSQACQPSSPRKFAKIFHGESLTETSHKAECDINNIMARYVRTGTLDHINQYEGQYLDCPTDDYFAAETKVAAARSMFEELPSRMRRHFHDDPATFLQFCNENDDASDQLLAIAEGYRKQALGVGDQDAIDQIVERPKQSGKDAATGDVPKTGEGPPGEGEGGS